MGNGYLPAAPKKNPSPPARQSAVCGEDVIYISICSGGAIIKISATRTSAGRLSQCFLEIDAFHRERRIPVRRGRSRHEVKPFYIRFCFPDTATADAFRNRFGGECLTHAPVQPKPRTSATSSDNSRSNGKPDATACGRSSRKLTRRCDSDGITQSPNRGIG
jgi:hypothetical protein